MSARILPILPVKLRIASTVDQAKLKAEGFCDVMSRVYAGRNVKGAVETQGGGAKLLPWKDLKGINETVSYLIGARKLLEHVVIVADYDSDGATSCALLYLGLKRAGFRVSYKVPNRFRHGYGLTPSVVQEVKEEFSPNWIITVDNGIAAHAGINLAHEYGIGVLVTDHHLAAQGDLPKAESIVNPNQPGCPFLSKNLAGVGVAFYVLVALYEKMRQEGFPDSQNLQASRYLDLVALGTVADVVRLDLNNRILVQKGLEQIRKGNCSIGVSTLFGISRRASEQATTTDLGFSIGPRLNAAGRLEDMSIGIQCLISENTQEARMLALELNELNIRRKDIENDIQSDAVSQLIEQEPETKSSLCVYGSSFHEGVIGIVAGRLKEYYHRPSIVFADAQEKGYLKGSARSIPGFHLRDGLDLVFKRNPDLINKFGGHAMAAGLTIEKKNFEKFKKTFEEVCAESLSEEILDRFLLIDGSLSSTEIRLGLARQIAKEVWGQGFEVPLFVGDFEIQEQEVLGDLHMKCKLKLDQEKFEAINFFNPTTFPSQSKVRVVYTLSINQFNGEQRLQLMIKQIESLAGAEKQGISL